MLRYETAQTLASAMQSQWDPNTTSIFLHVCHAAVFIAQNLPRLVSFQINWFPKNFTSAHLMKGKPPNKLPSQLRYPLLKEGKRNNHGIITERGT